ncbi:uncharacterized protein LOC135392655 [Ornithodoros turicata]|uniref:uncharacterized protein LOC135392655 n=1 Tax=Ornithodoros turicata TaxID=34597 RepID=UPI0031394EE0
MERRQKVLLLRGLLVLKQAQMVQMRRRKAWMQVMRTQDPDLFLRYYRMTPDLFDKLHDMVREKLTKEFVVCEPISSGERLAMTLRYLISGSSIMDIAKEFRVGLETAREAVHLTCEVLWQELSPHYMKRKTGKPSQTDFGSAGSFRTAWGAVDGKHIQIDAPPKTGSLYYNYKC